MKTWIKRSLFALLGTSVLLGGLAACGHRHHEFGASMSPEKYAQKRDKMVDKVAGRLDLNAEQKKHLQTLGDTLYAQRTALIGQTQDPRAEMKALVAGDKFDAVRAQALITDKTTALQSKSPEVIAALAEFYNSLNPAQQQKLRDFMDGRGRWFWHG
jgi:Spy/CpxP family protein refolding chaperone